MGEPAAGFPGDPETSEEPKGAHDGEPRNGSIADAAENGEEFVLPEPPPISADKAQLNLPGLGNKKSPSEAKLKISAIAVAIDGLLDPEEEVQIVVSGKPGKIEMVPIRDNLENVIGWKRVQTFRPTYALTPEQAAEFAEQRAAAEREREDALGG